MGTWTKCFNWLKIPKNVDHPKSIFKDLLGRMGFPTHRNLTYLNTAMHKKSDPRAPLGILQFIYDHPENPWVGGGGARRVAILAERMRRRGHRVDCVSGRFAGARGGKNPASRWEFVGLAAGYALSTFSYAVAAAWRARRRAREYDLVIEDFAPWNPLFTYRLRGAPAVLQVQNYWGRELMRRYGVVGYPFFRFERWYPRRFRHCIVVNRALNRSLGISGEEIPMGVEESWLECPRATGDYIAFLGRIAYWQKGLDILLEAARQMNLPLRLAGDGPDAGRVQTEIASMPGVEWEGRLEAEAKRAFLQRARMVVLPSRFEGQPLVALEAAALGKPLVVSDINELAFVSEEGMGVDFPMGDAAALAERAQSLWSSHEKLGSMGARARAFATRHTWRRITDRFEACCRRVVAQTQPPTT